MKSFIPWVGGKSKLLWLIHKLSPSRYSRFIDVFGGSGTVTLSRPIQQGKGRVLSPLHQVVVIVPGGHPGARRCAGLLYIRPDPANQLLLCGNAP